MHNSSYRTLQDNEEKYICEVPVDPIFMQHTDKIVVKVLKNTVNINSHGERKNEFDLFQPIIPSRRNHSIRNFKSKSEPRLEIEQTCDAARRL